MNTEETIKALTFLGDCMCAADWKEALNTAIKSLEKTSDKNCSKCIDKGRCAIYDNFYINYCSDWRKA